MSSAIIKTDVKLVKKWIDVEEKTETVVLTLSIKEAKVIRFLCGETLGGNEAGRITGNIFDTLDNLSVENTNLRLDGASSIGFLGEI